MRQEFGVEASKAEEAGASKTEERTEVVNGEKREREELIKELRDFREGIRKGKRKTNKKRLRKTQAKRPRNHGFQETRWQRGKGGEKKTKGRQRKTSTKANTVEPKKCAGHPKTSVEGEPQEHQQETNVASEDVPAGHLFKVLIMFIKILGSHAKSCRINVA
jgi:hypothetical protein